jgi:hypothetical protein
LGLLGGRNQPHQRRNGSSRSRHLAAQPARAGKVTRGVEGAAAAVLVRWLASDFRRMLSSALGALEMGRNMRVAKMRDVAGLVCCELGAEWHVADPETPGQVVVRVNGPDSQLLEFWSDGGLLEICGEYPLDGTVSLPTVCRVTVKADKKPAEIARHVMQRLLPEYQRRLATELLRRAARDSAAQSLGTVMAAVKSEFPTLRPCHREQFTPPAPFDGRIILTSDGSTCHLFELWDVPLELMRQMLAAVVKHGDYPYLGE